MRLALDVDVLRDQLLNILLAARDTVSGIRLDLPPFHSTGVLTPPVSALDDSFVISRDIPFRPTSGCLEEGSRGDSRSTRSRGAPTVENMRGLKYRKSQSIQKKYAQKVPHRLYRITQFEPY
jgi:hypothetical protein